MEDGLFPFSLTQEEYLGEEVVAQETAWLEARMREHDAVCAACKEKRRKECTKARSTGSNKGLTCYRALQLQVHLRKK